MADFNFNLNRQGPQGVQGPQGEPGFSPTISVDTNTAAEYKLLVTTVDGSFVTDNLRGNAVEDRGGTYMRFDPETSLMFAGNADVASEYNYGEVIIASDEDIENGAEDKVVTADRIFDLSEIVTGQGSTLTSLQTQIDEISGEIPTVNDGTLTFTQNGQTLGTFSANTANNVTINIPEGRLPNTGNLTIQKNGTTVGTFNADSSTNVTVNIPVPTDTSDLTNGAGFITSADIDLSDYVTNSTLTTTLTDYVQTTTLTSTLANYVETTTLANTLTDYVQTTTLATVATTGDYDDLINKPTIPTQITVDTSLSSTSENPVQNKVIKNTIDGVISEIGSNSVRIGTIENDYMTSSQTNSAISSAISNVTTSTLNPTDITHVPTSSAVGDYVSTQISQITPPTPTNMVTTDTAQTISGLKTFGDSNHNVSFTPNAQVTFADGSTRRVDDLKIYTSNTTAASSQAAYAQITLDAVGGSGSVRTYGRIGVNPYSPGQLLIQVKRSSSSGLLTMTTSSLLYTVGGTSYNLLHPTVAKATSTTLGTVQPDNSTIEIDSNGVISTSTTIPTVTTMSTAISTATSTMVTSTTIREIVSLTQAQYDALATKDANTFYIITDAV